MGFVRLALLSVALYCTTPGCTDKKTNTPGPCAGGGGPNFGCCIDAECGPYAICVQHICILDWRIDFSSLRDMALPPDAAGSGDLSLHTT